MCVVDEVGHCSLDGMVAQSNAHCRRQHAKEWLLASMFNGLMKSLIACLCRCLRSFKKNLFRQKSQICTTSSISLGSQASSLLTEIDQQITDVTVTNEDVLMMFVPADDALTMCVGKNVGED